uniref:Facilitated trehalose transporter Tret1-1 n=2 Tax=Anoplophora glabripennis TaxID=217634 RepID=V5I8P1_ANOGL
METDFSNEKYYNKLKEVVYIPPSEEDNKPQLLQLENNNKYKDSYFLYLSAFTADLVAFATGCHMAWCSPALAKLQETDPNVNPLGEAVSSIQESWIASLVSLGAAVGPLFIGKLADNLGRKKTLILLSLPMLVAFITLAFSNNITLFYVARFVGGLGVGSSFAILPMYLGEITENHNRGKFGCIMAVFITLGILYPFVVGPLVSLRLFSFSCAIPLMLFLIFFSLFIPESPIFLISNNCSEEAKEALMKLRSKSSSQV